MNFEKSYKLVLSKISGLKYDGRFCRCEECLFIPEEDNNLLEIICNHISSKIDCQNAIKYLKMFVNGVEKNRKNQSHDLAESGNVFGNKKFQIVNACLRNNIVTYELDWEYLEKFFEGEHVTSEMDERWRLLTFREWTASNMIIPLALAHSGFVQVDPTKARCVFCNSIWKQEVALNHLHYIHYPTCKMLQTCPNLANRPISFRLICSFRMKLFLRDYADMYDDSHPADLPTTVQTLWQLFKSDEDNALLPDSAYFILLEALVSEGLRQKFKQKLLLLLPPPPSSSSSTESAELHAEKLFLLLQETQLRESKLCKICLERGVDTVLVPCGHFMSCGECSSKLRDCAICRKEISGTVLAFVPSLTY